MDPSIDSAHEALARRVATTVVRRVVAGVVERATPVRV
jgi:hypothetical protein